MTPLEAMAKAIASEEWGSNRAGGPWSKELWERLITTYRTMPLDIRDAHYLSGVMRQARAALLALAEADLPGETTEDRFGNMPWFRVMLRAIAEEGTGDDNS